MSDKKVFFDNIKLLCEANGISGREDNVVEIITDLIKDHCEYTIDNLNNIIAFKKGKKVPNKKMMVLAHTDEVGFIITGYTSDGCLKFAPVGGIDPKVVLGREVYIYDKNIYGVIGTKPIHMQNPEERSAVVPIDNLYIDIGAKTKDEVSSVVDLGDSVSFSGDYREFGFENSFIKAKAIDDRGGCAMMIDLITNEELEYDTHFVFCVQEEVGLRGSTVAAYTVEPEIAIILESTASGDVSGVKGNDRVSVLGEGAVVSYMDNGTIYDKELYNLTFELAKEHEIKCQTKTMISGGNDAGAVHKSRGGVKTIAVSMPSRYIHAANNVVCKADVISCLEIAKKMINKFGEI